MPDTTTKSSQPDNARLLTLLIVVGLLLICWFVRIHNLLLFPPFLDETEHISWASNLYNFHPFTGAINGRLLGLWWMAAFGLYGDSALWLARVATALFGMIGIATIYSLGRYFVSPGIGMLSALIYALSPYALFFDRMALSDNYIVTTGLLATWFAVRFTRTARTIDGLLCGLALAGAVLAKAQGIALAVLPLLALLLLTPSWSWRQRLRGLALSYGTLLLIWIPFYLFLLWRGYGYYGTATSVFGTGEVTGIFDRLISNLQRILQMDSAYLSLPFLVIALFMGIYLLLRRPRIGLFLIFAALLPLAGLLAFATRVTTRYIQFHVPFIVLLGIVGLGLLAIELGRKRRSLEWVIPLIALVGFIILVTLPFAIPYWNNPAETALIPSDRLEYITADSAGFALPEAVAYLEENLTDRPALVVGLIPNCVGLNLLVSEQIPITVECPYILIDGSSQPVIAARINQLAQEATDVDLWIILDNMVQNVSLDGVIAPLETAAVFERPDNVTHVTLYRLSQSS